MPQSSVRSLVPLHWGTIWHPLQQLRQITKLCRAGPLSEKRRVWMDLAFLSYRHGQGRWLATCRTHITTSVMSVRGATNVSMTPENAGKAACS